MNAYTRTAHDLASALTGLSRRPKVRELRPFHKSYFKGRVTYGVTVDGKSYSVSERELAYLEEGDSPEELELELFVDEDEDDDVPGGYSDAENLRWYLARVR